MRLILKSPRSRRAARRGTVYVLVLGVTTMLVVLGVAGARLARVVVERGSLAEDQARARLLALSHMDVVHRRIDGFSAWRVLVTDDAWDAAESYGGGQFQNKYVDEIDGAVAGDATQPFRLYVKATVGEAVRVYSVEFVPDVSDNLTMDARSLRQEPAD